MSSEWLSFSSIPHTTKLFNDFLHDFPKVSRFYTPFQPKVESASSWLPKVASAIEYPQDRRAAVAAVLERHNRRLGSSQKALDNIQRFRNGAYAVLTGQQVGFLGGPLFSILKALTAVRLAAQATRAGVDAVPIFWLATEDHDFEEVRNAVVQDTDGILHTVTMHADLPVGAPMSSARLTQAIVPTVEHVSALLGDGEIGQFIREAYVSGETVGAAFGKLFARIFAEFGVILLDASDPELHVISKEIYVRAVEQADSIEQALVARGKELHSAEYHEQVKVTESSTLLFGLNDGARTPIHRVNGDFEIGKRKVSRSDLFLQVREHPEAFSANVLLRPVVQDYMLPTLAYAGGPAEVAYFAQGSVVFERLLGRVTPAVPRFSATLIDARAQRLLKQYKLSVCDLFRDPERTRELIAERSLPSDLQDAFERAAASVEHAIESISKPLQKLDPTLVESGNRAGSKMRHQLNRLRTRAANAELRRNEIVSRHAAHLSSSLFPHKQMQERVITGVSFLARYGMGLMHTLYEATDRGCPEHQVIFLQ